MGSHHGQYELAAPVLPRTPEAIALHYIDNLGAKMEMLGDAYSQANRIAVGICDRVFPLPTILVRPLAIFVPPPTPQVAVSAGVDGPAGEP